MCETKYQGGGIAPVWGSAPLPLKVSRDMGYRSDSIAVSRDMGPLSTKKQDGPTSVIVCQLATFNDEFCHILDRHVAKLSQIVVTCRAIVGN